jgi:AraC-like DNA-binding protein
VARILIVDPARGGRNATKTSVLEKEVLGRKTVYRDLKRARALTPACKTRGEILAAQAVRYVSEKLYSVRSVGQVAGALGVSREHVSRSFKRHLGCSVWSFVTALRVEEAQKLLHGPMLVKEIARDVGFGSDSSFLRAFVKHFGMLPCEYRKKVQQGALAGSEPKHLRPSNEPQARLGE